MSAASISDSRIKLDGEATPTEAGEIKETPRSNPAKAQVPPRQVPVLSATIFNEGARGQDPKYPPDRPGEAAGENGRAWKIYKDRVKDIDDDLLEGWNDTVNMLLVFAGLFSAACTAFLIEVSKNLQPDWQQATSLAVFAIYAHLNSTGPAPFEVPNPLSFTPTTNARWINGLWFTSLTLSLVVSFLAIFAKQWLNEYKSRMRSPSFSPKMWAMRHNAFKGDLERWGMDAFISLLHLLLHAALFFFLTGLCLLLMPLDDYIVAGLAPLFWGDFSSATPMLRYLYSSWSRAVVPLVEIIVSCMFAAYLLLIAIPLFLVCAATYAVDKLLWTASFNASWTEDESMTTFYEDQIMDPVEGFFE